jgi:hypothetical protein
MTEPSEPPQLETGWLPSTPDGDTYLRRFLLNWARFCGASAESLGGQFLTLPAMRLADARRPAAFANCATLLQPLDAESVPQILGQISEFYAFEDASHSGEVLLCSAWPTGDLSEYGWHLMGHPPVHLLPRGATPTPPPPELRISEVRDLEALHTWERVGIAAYPLEGLLEAGPGAIVHESGLADPCRRMWIGWVDEVPVGAASAWIEHGINDVTLVVTMPEARRRGYGEALTWVAAQADPALPSMLLSSDDGRPVYERMGFLPLVRVTLWYRNRQG